MTSSDEILGKVSVPPPKSKKRLHFVSRVRNKQARHGSWQCEGLASCRCCTVTLQDIDLLLAIEGVFLTQEREHLSEAPAKIFLSTRPLKSLMLPLPCWHRLGIHPASRVRLTKFALIPFPNRAGVMGSPIRTAASLVI